MGYKTFVDGLLDLEWIGVNKINRSIPNQVGNADLPLLFPEYPTVQSAIVSTGASKGFNKQWQVQLYLLVLPMLKGNEKERYDKLVKLMDDNLSVLDAHQTATGFNVAYTMTVDRSVVIGQTEYFTLTIAVTGRDVE